MHPLDALAADPDRLAEIEAAARRSANAVMTSSAGHAVIDEAATVRLASLIGAAPAEGAAAGGEPRTRGGQRLWRLAVGFERLLDGVLARGSGPVAPTFDEHDRAAEAGRGGWFRVRADAYAAFSDLVRGGLYPPEVRALARSFWDALSRTDHDGVYNAFESGLDLHDMPAYGHAPPVYHALRSHYRPPRREGIGPLVRSLVRRGARADEPFRLFQSSTPETPVQLALRHDDLSMAALLRHLSAGPSAPEASGAVLVYGEARGSGAPLYVRASTPEELREALVALGVTGVEAGFFVTVDSHGAGWTKTYGLDDLPALLDGIRKVEAQANAGVNLVFDVAPPASGASDP